MIIALQTLVFFRESLINFIDQLLRPYYKRFSVTFSRNSIVSSEDDNESEEQVFSEFDDDRGVVFYPPMYLQRYAAVTDCLMDVRWSGKLEKVVDLGCHDISFIKTLQAVPGLKSVMGVDIVNMPIHCYEPTGQNNYSPKRDTPLQIMLFQGNAADPDYRLIGCDAVIAIEMIEHMLPHDLDRLIHNVFGFIKPWIAVFTTPNGDFNVLFKALEKNGLRRLDHFFEWTREQFNDWCGNIVTRYPQYTVSCKGIGPGPPGTEHLGCCSQMALFVAKDYHKQPDLNLNSLALVANTPVQYNVSDMIGSLEIPDTLAESNTLCQTSSFESFSEVLFSDEPSYVTVSITSPTNSFKSMDYEDKISQCNLDTEFGKNFMFDDEQLCHILMPRKNCDSRVYEIEDVTSRLNCTTQQVKKFSKATQKFLPKNKLDSLTLTHKVMNEIRQLMQMLNLDKDSGSLTVDSTWHNFNWGENAPYWNQYYKLVREFSYPYKIESDGCRILDLISDEINRLIHSEDGKEFAVDENKFEFPIDYFMKIIAQISLDVENLKELLEWNGYEVVDNVIIYSSLDTDSVGSKDDDGPQLHMISNCCNDHTIDLRSTTISDRSTFVPDYNGLCLRRELDDKVCKLRKISSNDEDFAVELNRIVCRLINMALRSSRNRGTPPSTRWMQRKLLDLLTMAETNIEQRKRHFIENYSLKAIHLDNESNSEHMSAIEKIRNDDAGKGIVDKYIHLVKDEHNETPNMHYMEIDLEDKLSIPSTTEILKDGGYVDASLMDYTNIFDGKMFPFESFRSVATKFERTQSWVEEDVNFENEFGFTDNLIKIDKRQYKKPRKSLPDNLNNTEVVLYKKYKRKNTETSKIKNEKNYNKRRYSIPKTVNKVLRKKSSCNNLFRNSSRKLVTKKYSNYGFKVKKMMKRHHARPTKPIPRSLIELCHPEIRVSNISEDAISPSLQNNSSVEKPTYNIAVTEESLLIDIIMEDYQETIALRRTVGTDANDEQEILVKSVSGHISLYDICGKQETITENVNSQTIFLNDINEPSTSKGIRHNKTNAQCGPDLMPYDSFLSTSTSFHGIPKTISRYNIGDLCVKSSELGTCKTDEYSFNKFVTTPTMKLVGIRIKDSDTNTSCNDNILSFSDNKNINSEGMYLRDTDTNSFNDDVKVHRGSNNPNDVNNLMYHNPDKLCVQKTDSVFCIPNHNFNFIDVSCKSNIQHNHTNIKDANFISTTQENYQIKSKMKSVGIHIKDLDTNFNKIECSTMTDDVRNASDETQFLKPVLNYLNTVDSSSDFNISGVSKTTLSQTLVQTSSHKNLKSYASKELHNVDNNEFTRPKLSCGRVHINSYKDKQAHEDVIYQGEWQSYKPKVSFQKKHQPRSLLKNVVESKFIRKKTNSKEKISTKTTTMNEIQPMSEKLIPMHNMTTKKPKLDIPKVNKVNSSNKNGTILTSVPKVNKTFRSVTKVASKTTMRLITSKTKITRQAKIPTILSVNKKEGTILQNLSNKNYIPPYLKRNLQKIKQSKINKMTAKLDIVGTSIKMNKALEEKLAPRRPVVNEKTQQIKKDLLNIDNLPRENICYLVFRNEIENNENSSVVHPEVDKRNNERKNNSLNKRPCSSPSPNTSTCSSPNSIATVRQSSKCPKTSKKSSNTSRKSSMGNSDSDSPIPPKNKKISIRVRSKNKCVDKIFDNKENVPQTSEEFNNVIEKKNIGKNNSVFIAQIKKDSLSKNNSVSKNQTPNKNSNMPALKSCHTLLKSAIPVSTKNKPFISHFMSDDNDRDNYLYNSDMNLVLETQQTNINLSSVEHINVDVLDKTLLTDKINSFNENVTEIQPSIVITIRQFLEEILDFISSSFNIDNSFESETIILSRDDLNQSLDDSISSSYKTAIIVENNINTTIGSDLGNAPDRTFDSTFGDESTISLAETRWTVADNLDMISFKSITTVSNYSDYLLSANELNNFKFSEEDSVHDIFERKHEIIMQKPPGPLPLHMLSGFSIDAEAIAGDIPDPINYMDSETGSIAIEIPRQAISEELLVSGRSSGSYESCVLDEDSVIPNWLFSIINQQHSIDEEGIASELVVPEDPVILPRPISDPMLDANNNVEPVLGVGAGDGIGMHSDHHSQNSSGRGTSLSSTETSSGQQSETILINPFTGQFEHLRESVDSAIVISNSNFTDAAETFHISHEVNEDAATASDNHEPNLLLPSPFLATSDFDADISSLETDAPESSDN